ncbi:AMSH-like ubiquitin thioesterase 2 isoform X2 [Mercurialis annua]|uniref:AMSH-like ubiquitin thioesterase 2 isoform X2 n=1 Tax=Mercurialis annua TaxID=3986 RepID=UPI00215E99D0|nr:AMSH-like ubiquitin thioesterase 2 isoform X2 [Mercurialis annua]
MVKEDETSSSCLHNLDTRRQHMSVHRVTQSSPSPILSCVEKPPKHAHVRFPNSDSSSDQSASSSNILQDIHISERLMEDFLELARENTDKDLETCGVLAAFREMGTYYVTSLIIPKQNSTSSSCEAIKEEEFFAIQSEGSLCPVGWIHTHPSQSCFMSSIDLHTQYSYQELWIISAIGARWDGCSKRMSRYRIPSS